MATGQSRRPRKKAAADGLEAYRAKRDFAGTPEPAGTPAQSPGGNRYLIQKHAARRLHYDFRLELDGTLKSWAVTRGPSLDPADRRLAVHVEDHPLDYGDFEGVIPQGQYGGGTVMLWDRGSWEPVGNAGKDYAAGKLKFRLHGERLRGGWMLVRMGGRVRRERADNWLLIKESDAAAVRGDDGAFLEANATSIVSGRSMDEIAQDRERIWRSDRADSRETPVKRRTAAGTGRMPGARKASLPAFVKPELATLVSRAPAGRDWLHEIKFDGYRTLCRLEKGQARLLTRNNQDWTAKFRPLARAAASLPVKSALIDGEVVVLQENGVSDFAALQAALSEGRDDDLRYYVFDLLHLDGRDLTRVPLETRKAALRPLIEQAIQAGDLIQYSDHQEGQGPDVLQSACGLALEGIISKRRDAPYRSGRGGDWLKVKCGERQEFVIGGFTEPTAGDRGIGALLLGYHEGDKLVYAGRVGTGFTVESGNALRRKLQPLVRKSPPFAALPALARKGAIWVAPKLVCEIDFHNWTTDGRLRHASFQGLREDKPAAAITRERPAPLRPRKTQSGRKRRSKSL